MSPLSVRRYRAERLLRQEFEALRKQVLTAVRGRLRASGVELDQTDLEACYAQAWQGLYALVLEGQEIANPAGWLVLVSFRRAIDEHRARARVRCAGDARPDDLGVPAAGRQAMMGGARELDLAGELDERARLRQLFEGLRGRLSPREREAAVLCYLHGLSRAEAAVRMGVSEGRMRKLMEGAGPGRPGVARKVGALIETIRAGGWCAEQGSLMRGLAYGILAPDGERYQLALMHSSQCPACRSYVASLRGLAAALPPVALPWTVGAGALALCGEGARGFAGAASASGAAGAGGALGGGWLLAAGPLGTKLAVGCLLALGVGAGCVALETGPAHSRSGPPQRHHSDQLPVRRVLASRPPTPALAGDAPRSALSTAGARGRSAAPLTAFARASREFGPEQTLASSPASTPAARSDSSARSPRSYTARSASAHFLTAEGRQSAPVAGALATTGEGAGVPVQRTVPARASGSGRGSGVSAAQREFAPG